MLDSLEDYKKYDSSAFDYECFKNEFLKLTGINLHLYKEKQMKRRINTLMERKGFTGYEQYMHVLQNDPAELESFNDYITINVTEFFRTTEQWQYFEENVLRKLISEKKGRLKIWSCACSTGEEPYSLVMSMAGYLPLEQIRVVATDIDRDILKQAAKGVFSQKSMEAVPDALKQKYFSQSGIEWSISEEIKKCVEFRHLDLLQDDFPAGQDLIICRNVLIYFTEEAKNEIYRKFHESLAEGGFLFTGNTEQLIQFKALGFQKEKNFLYKKVTG